MPAPTFRRRLLAALGLGLVLTLYWSGLLSPRPAPRYTVTDLGVLPGDTESGVSALNSRGVAAGFSHGAVTRACVLGDGQVTSLGVLPGESEARGINSQGELTGLAWLPTGTHAFLYSGGKMRDLGTLPGFHDSAGAGINDRGEVVVNAMSSPMQPGRPQGRVFLYCQGRMTDIGLPPGCSEGHAVGINHAGKIIGDCSLRRPFLYDSRIGTMTLLPVPLPYRRGWVNHINDSGQVIGDVSQPDGNCHAALWHGNQMTDLGTPTGYSVSIGSGLNNRGEAVGHCFDEGSVKAFLRDHVGGKNPLRRYLDRDMEHAFVYQGGKMQDLNDLIPRDADWTLESARGINDRGQIVGQGLHGGQERAFLLTPR